MPIELDAWHLGNGLSGVLYLALALVVRFAGTPNASSRAFSLFAGGLGSFFIVLNFFNQVGGRNWLTLTLAVVSAVVAVVGVLRLARLVTTTRWRQWSFWHKSTVFCTVAMFLISMARLASRLEPMVLVEALAYDTLVIAAIVAAAACSVRFEEVSGEQSRQMALMAGALYLFPIYIVGVNVPLFIRAVLEYEGWMQVLFAVGWAFNGVAIFSVLAAWILLTRAGAGPTGAARNVVLVVSLVGAYALVETIKLGHLPDPPGYGITRTLSVLVLAYAILRHQAFGIDTKIRFTISKSTVAAIFVAVFFIASEGAAQFFGDRFNNNYIGIAAAGLLVLGISPLQRLADRMATAAVPGPGKSSVESAYMAAVRAAHRDGTVTRREERHLAEVAEHLDLSPTKALALREQVESE